MEPSQMEFLEELFTPRKEISQYLNNASTDFFPTGWIFDSLEEYNNPSIFSTSINPSLTTLISSPPPLIASESSFENYPLYTIDPLIPALPDFMDSSSVLIHEDCYPSTVEDVQERKVATFDMGFRADKKKAKNRKLEGQPSKNLMAERRRRKRLNDRLSMLRSIVPKISKMDRTSILGDAIDYMKELLDKINKLRDDGEQEKSISTDPVNPIGDLKDLKPNEAVLRNTPKFEVKRKELETRIDVRCPVKLGLLRSTVCTLEALGLEIQECVISCFSDFSMQASCSEVNEQRAFMSSEDIRQALFRNAGYGGRNL